MNKNLIIIIGPPGSGKGTQGKLLAKKYGCQYLEIGKILRSNKDPEIIKIINSGKLVSDKIIFKIINQQIAAESSCFIFDGFPRNFNQAKEIDKIIAKKNFNKIIIIEIELPDEEVIKRLSNRKTCKNCRSTYAPFSPKYQKGICSKCGFQLIIRDDDRPQTIKNRLKLYRHEIKTFLPYLNNKYMIVKINGKPSIASINQNIVKKLESSF